MGGTLSARPLPPSKVEILDKNRRYLPTTDRGGTNYNRDRRVIPSTQDTPDITRRFCSSLLSHSPKASFGETVTSFSSPGSICSTASCRNGANPPPPTTSLTRPYFLSRRKASGGSGGGAQALGVAFSNSQLTYRHKNYLPQWPQYRPRTAERYLERVPAAEAAVATTASVPQPPSPEKYEYTTAIAGEKQRQKQTHG